MNKVIFVALLILGIGIVGVLAMTFFQSSFSKVGIHKEERVESSKVEDIVINTSSADVEIVPSESNEVVILLDGKINKDLEDQYEFHIDHSSNKLNIDYLIDENTIGIKLGSVQDTKLQVMVPSKVLNNLQITTTSGDVSIDDLKANELTVKSSSGDQSISGTETQSHVVLSSTSGNINTRENTMNSTDFITTSGKIDAKDLRSKNAVFETSSGDIVLNGEQLKSDMEFITSSGDVAIKFAQTPESVKVDFKGSSGEPDISVDGLLFEDKNENSAVGVKGNGDYEIKVRTSSGDLTLQ
jgi:lia operon protein LiaG